MNVYNVLDTQKIDVRPLVNYEFKIILQKIKRRLTLKQRLKNPWQISIKHLIQKDIYYQWFRAVRDHITHFDRNISTIKDRRNITTKLIIEFTDLRSLIFHCSKAYDNTNTSARNFVKKLITDCKANLLAPVVFDYDCKKNSLHIRGRYEVSNRYGNVISC